MKFNERECESLAEVEVIVFDIVGTLLDSTGTTIKSMTNILHKYDISNEKSQWLAEEWLRKQSSFQEEIINGKQPWVIEDDIRQYQLQKILEKENIFLNQKDFNELSSVGEYFKPWPRAPEQLHDLCSLITTVGLTNSGFVQIIKACTKGKLYWHALMSTQFVQTYKPHPAAYKLAINLLEVNPSKVLFVSTHPWDLRGASSHGLLTAYLPRDYASKPNQNDNFDLRLESLDELIEFFNNRKI